MPLYGTICKACDNRKDVLVRSHDTPLPMCSREMKHGPCEGRLERAVSAPGFVLKGNGWYDKGRPAAGRTR